MRSYLLVVFILFSIVTNAQTDTLFWFAAPEITSGGQSLDRPILLRITAYSKASIVTISQPANPAFLLKSIVPKDSLVSFDLTQWIDSIENKPANTILNFGIEIQATEPISA